MVVGDALLVTKRRRVERRLAGCARMAHWRAEQAKALCTGRDQHERLGGGDPNRTGVQGFAERSKLSLAAGTPAGTLADLGLRPLPPVASGRVRCRLWVETWDKVVNTGRAKYLAGGPDEGGGRLPATPGQEASRSLTVILNSQPSP